jgi:hypothetical protein
MPSFQATTRTAGAIYVASKILKIDVKLKKLSTISGVCSVSLNCAHHAIAKALQKISQ